MLDAALEKFHDAQRLCGRDGLTGRELFQRQLQCVQRQIDRLIARVGGAVPIVQAGFFEPPFATTRKRAYGGGSGAVTPANQARRDSV